MATGCTVCGWPRIAAVAAACGRCGAPVERARGLAGLNFSMSQGGRIETDFLTAARQLAAGGDPHLQPVAWTGCGSSVALLVHNGRSFALERLLPAADGAVPNQRLVGGLGEDLLGELVAPPLATRTGICLVTTRDVRLHLTDDPHLPRAGETISWSADETGERICGAAIDGDGDLFVATDDAAGGPLTVRSADGRVLAVISGLALAPGADVGFAVQASRRGAGRGPRIFHAWAGGRLARQEEGAAPEASTIHDLPGLEAPPRSWFERRRVSAAPWYGWNFARAGVYPVEIEDSHGQALHGLVLGGPIPKLVRFARGRYFAVAVANEERYLVAGPSGMRVIDARVGHLVAERHEETAADCVFAGTSSGTFICLSAQRGRSELLLRGLQVRGGDLVESFRSTLRVPRNDGAPERPLRADPALVPLETDSGLLVALEEGTSGNLALRLWNGSEALRAAA